MNINNFDFKEKGVFHSVNNTISYFFNEISELLKNNNKSIDNSKVDVEDGSVCVICGLNDEKLILLNVQDGKEFDIYISTSKDDLNRLYKKGIYSNIYEMEEKDLFNLTLGSKLIMSNGKFELYEGKLDIKDADIWYRLNDMYGSIKEDEGKEFVVKDITDKEIFLSNLEGGGYFSVYRKIYPNLEKGDIVKKDKGKYVKH